jgi:hypothetical protein
VLFVECEGASPRRINYCSGTETLGYSRKQIIGTDFIDLLPPFFRKLHQTKNFMINPFRQLEESPMLNQTRLLYFLNRSNYLVPMNVKMRPIIDKSGELFLVLIAFEDTSHRPVGILEGTTITLLTQTFENVLLTDLDIRKY